MRIQQTNTINFTSNRQREAELRELRRLQEQRRLLERQNLLQSISYPSLDNSMSTQVAGFLSKFTCAIQNASEHNVMEFFGDEQTAQSLRKNLSPECQADSKMLRKEIQTMQELKDPVMMLLSANKMKKFAPKEGILSPDQQHNFIEGLKNTVSTVVRNSDLEKFEPEDKAAILEMVQKVENSTSVNFGIEEKLKVLVDRLNSKKVKIGFIPPVKVRELGLNKIKLK